LSQTLRREPHPETGARSCGAAEREASDKRWLAFTVTASPDLPAVLYTDGKRTDFPLDETIRQFRGLASQRPDLCRVFVQIQLEAALQGGGLGAVPRSILERICAILGVSPLEFASLEAMLRMRAGRANGAGGGPATESRLADAYQVLGVAASATDAEVKKAYRRLMSQNHPDKLVANGLPESMVAAAHERTQRILEAYDLIRDRRGIR